MQSPPNSRSNSPAPEGLPSGSQQIPRLIRDPLAAQQTEMPRQQNKNILVCRGQHPVEIAPRSNGLANRKPLHDVAANLPPDSSDECPLKAASIPVVGRQAISDSDREAPAVSGAQRRVISHGMAIAIGQGDVPPPLLQAANNAGTAIDKTNGAADEPTAAVENTNLPRTLQPSEQMRYDNGYDPSDQIAMKASEKAELQPGLSRLMPEREEDLLLSEQATARQRVVCDAPAEHAELHKDCRASPGDALAEEYARELTDAEATARQLIVNKAASGHDLLLNSFRASLREALGGQFNLLFTAFKVKLEKAREDGSARQSALEADLAGLAELEKAREDGSTRQSALEADLAGLNAELEKTREDGNGSHQACRNFSSTSPSVSHSKAYGIVLLCFFAVMIALGCSGECWDLQRTSSVWIDPGVVFVFAPTCPVDSNTSNLCSLWAEEHAAFLPAVDDALEVLSTEAPPGATAFCNYWREHDAFPAADTWPDFLSALAASSMYSGCYLAPLHAGAPVCIVLAVGAITYQTATGQHFSGTSTHGNR